MLADDLKDLLLRPLNAATSKSAWRAYLSAVLFVLTSVVLLAVAFLSYGVFYTTYIPQVNVQRVVHLQFGYAAAAAILC